MAATIKIIVETSGGVDKVKSDLAGLGDTAQKAGGGFSSMQQVAVGALREVGALTVNVLGQAAMAATKFIGDSVTAAGDFQSKLQVFGAAAGKGFEPGTEGLKQFHDLFLQLGKDLPVSTAEVEDAATALVKGGLDPAVVAGGALKDSLQFAAAAGMGLADAAELSIKQLATFVPTTASVAEQTTFLANAQNLLVKAAGASTLDVDKLGDAVLAAGGAAKASGVEYNDFITTMGMISGSFPSAAEAGTSYKNFLTRLIPTTKSATDAMQALGLVTEDGKSKFYDANGAFVGNRQAAEMLKQALGGLTAEERAGAMATIFGNDAKNAAIALMDQGAQGYDIFAQKMADANGVMAQSAATQQGYDFAMTNFKGTVEALQITLGEKLLPVLTQFLMSANQGLGVILGLADGSLTLDQGLAALSTTLLGIIAPFLGVVGATGETNAAFTSIQQTATAVFGELQPYITNAMTAIGAYVGAVTAQIAAFWQTHGAEIMAFVKETWDTISDIIATVSKIVLTIITSQFGAAAAFIQAHGAQIQQFLGDAWRIISGLITAALALIQGIVKTTLALIQGDWSGAWRAIQDMSVTFVTSIGSAIVGFLDMIAGAFGTSISTIIANWSQLWNDVKAYVSNIDWAAVGQSVIDGIANGITGAAQRLADAAADAANSALQAAKDALGISSPSKVFAAQVGVPMAQGMALGLTRGAPMVAQAGAASAQAAVAGATTYNNYTLNFAPNYSSGGGVKMDYAFAKSLAGVV